MLSRSAGTTGPLVEPDWVGKLAGFTLLFEALVLMLVQQMPFAAVARTIGESWHLPESPLISRRSTTFARSAVWTAALSRHGGPVSLRRKIE
jgi:hypothetical protein